MPGRRSGRMPALSSPLALLDQAAVLHRALTREMAGLAIDGAHYGALERAGDALHRLAADLGHPGRLIAKPPAAAEPR